MSIEIKGRRSERKRSGLYLERHVFDEIMVIADREGLSFNETAHQLLEVGLKAVNVYEAKEKLTEG